MNIAQFSLNLAVLIYVFQLFPQLWRTASQKNITDLSTLMIRCIFLGWIMDVLYAKLYSMPIQYFIVSYLGLFQTILWIFLLFSRKVIRSKEMALLSMTVICVIFTPLKWAMKVKFLPILSIGQFCFWACWLSQLACSIIKKSANDISLISLLLSTIGTLCSLTAGSILGWEKQYLINLFVVAILHIFIFFILSYYRWFFKINASF